MYPRFYYDIVCPYAYMAFSFLHRSSIFSHKMRLAPILLGGLFKEMGSEPDPNRLLSATKAQYSRTDILRQGKYFGTPLKFHPRHPLRTVKAMRLLHACDEKQRLILTERLYQSYWQENLDIDDDDILNQISASVGIKIAITEEAKIALKNATAEAFSRKVFGVPTIEFNDRLYFGGDRLMLIAEQLGISLPDCSWQASQPIEFFFDFSSPYSYLAWAEVKKAMNEGVPFIFKPVLLGALFRAIGTHNIPMLSVHPHKAAYFMQDMADWARYRQTPFTFSTHFPLRTITALRLALLDARVIDPLFCAAWVQDLDINDQDCLLKILDQAGLSKNNLLERSNDDLVKEQLKSNTDEAINRGVFGVPTFFVRGQKVFGQDRFPWIRQENLGLGLHK